MAEIKLFKKDFIVDTDGSLYRTLTATPKTGTGTATTLEKGTIEYASSNEAVGTAVEDPNDETKVRINWVGPGSVQFQVKGDADRDAEEQREVSGTIDFVFEEDEADAIELTLDEVPA